MKNIILIIFVTLSFSALAGETRIKGKDAEKLFNQVFDSYPSQWEGNCGLGKCWVKGVVVCETNITDGVRKNKTTCTVSPGME